MTSAAQIIFQAKSNESDIKRNETGRKLKNKSPCKRLFVDFVDFVDSTKNRLSTTIAPSTRTRTIRPMNSNSPSAVTSKMTLGAIAKLDPETLLRDKEVAEALGFSKRTLERWRSRGGGPIAKKIGSRRVAYTVKAVLDFAGVAA